MAEPQRMRRRMLALLCASVLFAGCARSCKDEHPYVPYAVGDAGALAPAPSQVSAPTVTAVQTDAGASSVEPALVAPPAARTWKIEGLELLAPAGTELVLAIVRDFDGDGRKDALAIARPPAAAGKPHEVGAASIVAYRGADPLGTPRVVLTAPELRVDPSCAPVARLERVGPRSAYVEVGASCSRVSASRSAYVVRLSREPDVAFDLTLQDPAGAPKLTVDADGADRDADGIDDVSLRVSVEGGVAPFEPGPRLSGKLAFFDRPAGASRDPDEPEASLRATAAQASARARQPREAAAVPMMVQQLRSLYRAMCREGGSPRLLRRGEGIACGPSKALEDAGLAEVSALALQGDAVRALAVAERVQLAPATTTASRTTDLEKLLAQVAPLATVASTRLHQVRVPSGRGPHPEWGPLAFEATGRLLVRTEAKVVRLEPDSGEQEDTEIAPWPAQVLAPDGKTRWLETYHACDGVALRATFVPVGAEADVKEVLLPIAPALGTRCSGARGEAAAVTPLAWGPRGLEAIVAGQPLLLQPESSRATALASSLGEAPPPGSSRSPGAKAFALPTSRGVLVRGARAARYRIPELEPYADVAQCTVTDDARRLACARQGRIFTFALEQP